ncbi:hypothetical protein LSH36_24g12155 [Paralvinella palmiformis]|uniref:Cationic amino acid transporter C-terminal domain-containing protein n=1 Tax=Paralvinella palmiformis TaxID=53620 RepID=A0AAD9KAH5_9ANNE|nr:hypothetical protein LSH36_24g12155 [Paralvinella palmiformis]
MAKCKDCIDFTVGLTRKKSLATDLMTTNLRRCLNTLDLILMGIGYMVGTGIFVLTGQVTHFSAGPSVVISFILAGIAAAMSAVCYAEFSSLVPLSGSSYTYTYVVVGEIWAFLVGWNVILENAIGTSSAAKSFSGTLDSLCNGCVSRGIKEKVNFGESAYIGSYPDFVAFAIILFVMIFVLVGAKSSANFNRVMVIIKLIVIAIIIVAGFMLADLSNWIDPEKGGFFPYGAVGTISGAATCFYAFVGFDSLSTASEETKDPKRSLPIAIIGSLVIVTSLYILSAMSLTLMVPYTDIDPVSAFTTAFVQRGNVWATYVVGIGTLFGLATVVMSGLYATPRILYAMSNDGLIFKFLGYMHPKTQTPIISIVITASVSSLIALFFELKILIELLSIGTLFCFTFVAASIIIIRYNEPTINFNSTDDGAVVKEVNTEELPLKANSDTTMKYTSETASSVKENPVPATEPEANNLAFINRFQTILGHFDKADLVLRSLLIMLVAIIAFLLLLVFGIEYVTVGRWWAILVLIVTALGMIVPLLLIGCLEQCPKKGYFQVPLVPLIPAFSIFCNVGLMIILDWNTWIRLFVWITLGLILYFAYGVWHSKERHQPVSTYSELEPTEKQVN